MFDIGWGELVLIGMIALIVIGPKELPAVLRTLGQSMAKIKRMAGEFQGQFQEAMREAEVDDLKKQAEDLKSSVTDFADIDPLADSQEAIDHAAEGAGEPADEPTSDAAPEHTETTSSEPVNDAPTPDVEPTAAADIAVPLPDEPPPVSEKDFAAAEPEPPKAPKQAGGGA
jgi:sec-independent protein translocase protein TatB